MSLNSGLKAQDSELTFFHGRGLRLSRSGELSSFAKRTLCRRSRPPPAHLRSRGPDPPDRGRRRLSEPPARSRIRVGCCPAFSPWKSRRPSGMSACFECSWPYASGSKEDAAKRIEALSGISPSISPCAAHGRIVQSRGRGLRDAVAELQGMRPAPRGRTSSKPFAETTEECIPETK